jgi:hypothetical protein
MMKSAAATEKNYQVTIWKPSAKYCLMKRLIN